MLTRAALEALSDGEATRLLDTLATEAYGTTSWRKPMAETVGCTPITIYRWKQGRPPNWALLLMDRTVQLLRAERRLGKIKQAMEE